MSGQAPVAVVTGAARGIGRAVVERFLADGWTVVAADLDPTGCPDGCDAIEADVSTETGVKAIVDHALDAHGRIDAIVSNAGVSEFKSLAECSLDDWNRVLATNLTATFLLAKHAESALRAAKGCIVTIASTRAHMSEPDTAAYSASKGGLLALTHSLAVSLGPEVRVNCISPGWIHTGEEHLSASDHFQHPAGRVGTPDDVAHMAAYLVSDKAGFLTGAEFIVDGGMTRKMIYV